MSRSNGGEGREANPKVCASIIGAPQTVTHFSPELGFAILLVFWTPRDGASAAAAKIAYESYALTYYAMEAAYEL